MNSFLTTVDAAFQALADANTPEELIDLADRAEAMRSYAKRARLGMIAQNRCAEVRLRAERKVGELLAATPRLHGRPKSVPGENTLPSLSELGISADDRTIRLKQPFLQFAEHRRILGLLSHPHCLCLSGRLGPFTPKRQVTDQLVSNCLPSAVVVFDRVSRLIDVTDGTGKVASFNAARCWLGSTGQID
jgi:hypothetical protein